MTVKIDPLVGKKLGRYQIEAPLGQGRAATVYRATDPVFGRVVAIKVLDPTAGRDPEVVAAFLRDAEVLSRLSHPNILPIYEAAERDGVVYLARQHTDGGNLRGRLEQEGRLRVPEAIGLLRPIATALDYAHRQGFVHNNLRPSSILRTTAGQVYLTDFVVPGKEEATASAATTVISAIDAPEYASPEQARNISGVPSIDLYVLGVIVYQALTGRPPFQIESPGDSARNVLSRHLQAPPPAPRSLNPALGPAVEAVLLRALAKRPEDRYPSGAALVYALGEAYEQDRGQSRAQAAPAPERPARAEVRRGATGVLGGSPPRPSAPPPPVRVDSPAVVPPVVAAESARPDVPGAQAALPPPVPAEPIPSGPAAEAIQTPEDLPAPTAAAISDGQGATPQAAGVLAEAESFLATLAVPDPAPVDTAGPEADAGRMTEQSEALEVAAPPLVASAAPPAEPEVSPVAAVEEPSAASAPAPPATVPPARPAAVHPAQPAKRRSALPLVALVAGVVLVLGAVVLGAVMMLGHSTGTDARDAVSTPTIGDLGVAPTAASAGQPSAAPSAAPVAAATATSPAAAPAPRASSAPAPTAPTAASAAPSMAPVAATARPVATRQEVILFSSRRDSNPGSQIYAMAPDGQGVRPLTQASGFAWGPRIAPDGRSFSFSVAPPDQVDTSDAAGGLVGKGKHDLQLQNTDGSAAVSLGAPNSWNSGWSWSPDGKTLAFTSDRDGNWEIYTLTFPAGTVTRLTNNSAQDAWPSWTPDGKQIVFMSARDGYPQLYAMSADGKTVTRLNLSESADTFPVVSPDGTKIAYVSQTPDSDESEIYVIGIDGSNATRLTTTGGYNSQPAWSPDGTRLAFVSNRDGGSHIYVMRADGSGQTALTSGSSEDVTPTWGYLYLLPAALAPAEPAGMPLADGAVGPLLAEQPRRRMEPTC